MKIYKGGKISVMGCLMDTYRTDTGCDIMVSKDNGLWHLSISHQNRYPTWDEIKQARYDLLSRTKTFAMILPSENQYVSIHPNCFHLWEMAKCELGKVIDKL